MERANRASRLGLAALAAWAVQAVACADPESTAAKVTVEGTLTTIVADDFTHGRSVTSVVLHADDGTETRLRFGDALLPPAVPSGSRVRARGALLASGELETTAADLQVMRSRRAAEAVRGQRRVAVLLVKWAGDAETLTKDAATSLLFGGATSALTGYYAEDTFGQITLSGAVFGYYQLDGAKPACSAVVNGGLEAIAQAAAAKAQKDVDVSQYDHVVHLLTYRTLDDCAGVAGAGQVGGRLSWFMADAPPFATSHEFGHNFGLGHANAMRCHDQAGHPVVVADSCAVAEYGDPFDVMGNQGQRHHAAFHKLRLGVLTGNLQTVTADGDYTLLPTESPQSGTQVLRISAPWTNGLFYYFEYRAPFGHFDNFGGGDAVVHGVLMHLAPDVGVMEDQGTNRQLLLDATPDTASFDDAALAVGRIHADLAASDPAQRFTIEVLSAGGGQAKVRVKFHATAPSPSCADLASARGWPSHYCDTSSNGQVCGTEGFQTSDCNFCCPDPNQGGGKPGGCNHSSVAGPGAGGGGPTFGHVLLLLAAAVLWRRQIGRLRRSPRR